MRIRRPRGITATQLLVVTTLGVIAGVYIWQPLILKYKKENSTSAVIGESRATTTVSTETTDTPRKYKNHMNIKVFLKGAAGTPTGMMAIAVFSTLAIFGSYKLFIKPRVARNKQLQAEAYAEYLFQKELESKVDR